MILCCDLVDILKETVNRVELHHNHGRPSLYFELASTFNTSSILYCPAHLVTRDKALLACWEEVKGGSIT